MAQPSQDVLARVASEPSREDHTREPFGQVHPRSAASCSSVISGSSLPRVPLVQSTKTTPQPSRVQRATAPPQCRSLSSGCAATTITCTQRPSCAKQGAAPLVLSPHRRWPQRPSRGMAMRTPKHLFSRSVTVVSQALSCVPGGVRVLRSRLPAAGLRRHQLCEEEPLITTTATAATSLGRCGQQSQGFQGLRCAHVVSSEREW